MDRVLLPGRPGRQRASNPLQEIPGRQQASNPLPEIPGLQQVSNPLQEIPGRQRVSNLQQEIPGRQRVSNLQLDSSPRNRIVPPIAIPGRDRQVQATRIGITTPGARGRQGRSNTSRANPIISRAGHLLNLPVRHRRPGRVAADPQEVPGEDSYMYKS